MNSLPISDKLPLTVSQFTQLARQVLEQAFPLLWISGEISNLTMASSGHWYFSLKDAGAQVRCVMFRGRNQYLDFRPENGMHVEVRALATLYEARGDFQLNIEVMRRAGLGRLFEAFELLKARLAAEGLFAAERKKPLPEMPRQIGIVTSPAAAALQDVLTTLKRRMPGTPVILYPAPVQGEGAALQLARAIESANQHAACDVLIVCRGGGSIEDLWAFNEEVLARAIAASTIPVISGVGHETDITIADFVADKRAATPTAAAELAVPHQDDLRLQLQGLQQRASRAMERLLHNRAQQLDLTARRLRHPAEKLALNRNQLTLAATRLQRGLHIQLSRSQQRLLLSGQRLQHARPHWSQQAHQLDRLATRLQQALPQALQQRTLQLERLTSNLHHLNPLAVLERGYSIVTRADGTIVEQAAQISSGETIHVQLAQGSADAIVTNTHSN